MNDFEQMYQEYERKAQAIEAEIALVDTKYEQYSDSIKDEKRNELLDKLPALAADYQGRIAQLIDDSFPRYAQEKERMPENDIKMQNALMMLQMSGKNLTDATAANALEPFKSDFNAIEALLPALANLKGMDLATGYDALFREFPLTLGTYRHYLDTQQLMESMRRQTIALFSNAGSQHQQAVRKKSAFYSLKAEFEKIQKGLSA